MSSHRVIRRTAPRSGRPYFQVHEGSCNKGELIPHSWTENPVTPIGETVDELRIELELFLGALDLPVLKEITDENGEERLVECKEFEVTGDHAGESAKNEFQEPAYGTGSVGPAEEDAREASEISDMSAPALGTF